MYPLLFLLMASSIAFVNGATCQASLSELTSNAAAASYCSSALASVTAASGTVTSVVVISKTTTDLDLPTSTTTVASTTSIVSKIVATTYVSSSTAAERRRRRRAATSNTADATSLLSTLDTPELSAACSCIGALPTSNAALKTTATTTTITGEVWFTVGPRTTISTTKTVSTTEKTTVTRTAPSFDQVYGPEPGCADVNYFSAISYVNPLQTQDEIFQSCKDGCADLEDCVFVFVQNAFPNVTGLTPYWNCYYNNHALEETEDLECDKDPDRWGDLYGYDAVGRG